MPSDSDVLNAGEAAVFLRAHVETVRRLARRGDIPSFKMGKDWRFRKDELLRWSEEQRPPGKSCSVLIVDDEADVRRVLSKSIEQLGCRALQATNGVNGLELVAQQAPDLILLDLQMPEMNGPQFLEELRKTHPDLPVVIVTGYPDSELMARATQFGPLMLLAKPIDQDQLESTVRIVMGDRLRAG